MLDRRARHGCCGSAFPRSRSRWCARTSRPVATRSVPISRPNDEQVRIPANGFSLAGTLSKPAQRGRRPPARSPLSAATARPIATSSLRAFRFSASSPTPSPTPDSSCCATTSAASGRAAAAPNRRTLADYADDVRAAVKFLSERKDVDPKRIAIVGHSEGGLVAMLAAAKEKRIAGVALLATPGIPGRRSDPRQQAACAGALEAQRRREAGPHRAAEKDSTRP